MTIPHSIYFGFINFALLLGVLIFFLRRPVRDFFANRSAHLRKSISEARQARESALQQLKDIEIRLARVESEITAMRQQVQEEGELERAVIVKQAEEYAAKLGKDTERMIAQELKRTKELLRGTTVDLAILMAERYLREHIAPDDQTRLMRRYIERLGQLQ